MASAGSLDVVNLPTISADTRSLYPGMISPIRTRDSYVVGMSCDILELFYMLLFHKVSQPTDQQTPKLV